MQASEFYFHHNCQRGTRYFPLSPHEKETAIKPLFIFAVSLTVLWNYEKVLLVPLALLLVGLGTTGEAEQVAAGS